MKKYVVKVNGIVYDVELEEAYGGLPQAPSAPQTAAVSKAVVASPVVAAPAVPAAAPATPAVPAAPAGTGEKIAAPMPGNILAVNVGVGDSVKKGQVLMVLEAMKMENEIMCPCDGKVTSVNVSKGSTVETGTLLCCIG